MATRALGEAPIEGRATTSVRMPLRTWARTTPGLLRMLSIVAVVGLLGVAVVGVGVLTVRRNAIDSVRSGSGSELMTATQLYAALSSADATASSALLQGGAGSQAALDRYEQKLAAANRLLVDLAESAELSADAQQSTRVIAAQLSEYASRIATAETYVRSDALLAAAYMRAASTQMADEILPAATSIWRDAAVRLRDDYRAGASWIGVVGFAVAGGIVAVGLIAFATFLARRTRRALNLGVLGATVGLVAVVVGLTVLMAQQADALTRAREAGSDPAQTLSVAYFLSLQAQADANLALADRDTRDAYLEEFDETTTRIDGVGDEPGLFAAARAMGSRNGVLANVDGAERAFHDYTDVALSVRDIDEGRSHTEAVALALDDEPGGLAHAADQANDRLERSIAIFENRFILAADEARIGSFLIEIGLAGAMALAAAVLLFGVSQRIGDYR